MALLYNFASGLTFLLGGIMTYLASEHPDLNTYLLIPSGAGNFMYIAASNLIPRINREITAKSSLIHYVAFISGFALLHALTWV